MMIKEIVLATHNADKRAEIADLLNDLGMTVRTLAEFPQAPDVIEDGKTCKPMQSKKPGRLRIIRGSSQLPMIRGLRSTH